MHLTKSLLNELDQIIYKRRGVESYGLNKNISCYFFYVECRKYY